VEASAQAVDADFRGAAVLGLVLFAVFISDGVFRRLDPARNLTVQFAIHAFALAP